jgi:hypothetical protein
MDINQGTAIPLADKVLLHKTAESKRISEF